MSVQRFLGYPVIGFLVVCGFFCGSTSVLADTQRTSSSESGLEIPQLTGINIKNFAPIPAWLELDSPRFITRLMSNIGPVGTHPGAVIAAPYHQEQNYYFHWVRDAALVMNGVIDLYLQTPDPVLKNLFRKKIEAYLELSILNQHTYNRSAENSTFSQSPPLGEPKFHLDGRAFDESWGRPQNDGPALRAITFIKWIDTTNAQDRSRLIESIKLDLDFLVKYETQKSYDIWEETVGYHFYTRMAQRRALLAGATLLETEGDPTRAQSYRQSAARLENYLEYHWDSKRGIIRVTIDYDSASGMRGKVSDLDAAVVLASLHTQGSDGFYTPTSDRILATAFELEKAFNGSLYPINHRSSNHQGLALSPAMGRYPEDAYDGSNSNNPNGGNPWVLVTNAFAELYCRVAASFLQQGQLTITSTNQKFFSALSLSFPVNAGLVLKLNDSTAPQFKEVLAALQKRADGFFERNRFHGFRDESQTDSYSEQINRHTGAQQGATNLTWNYASFLSAIDARRSLNVEF